MYYRRRSSLGGLAGGIFLIFLLLGFLFGGGGLFLPLFFVGLAFCILIGSISSFRPNAIYGGIIGMTWMLGLALCFLIGFWPWILLPVALTMILGALIRPVTGMLAGTPFLAAPQPQQPIYQPMYQPMQQPVQPPQPPPATYQEGGNTYPYPPEAPPEQ